MFEQRQQIENAPAPLVPDVKQSRLWRKQWLGEVPYLEALEHQKTLRGTVRDQQRGIVLGLEHPRVITLGFRMGKATSIPRQGAIQVVKTDRGGQATLHNPGQLVIYPILPLRAWDISVREYVQLLLKTTENFCIKCNIIIEHTNKGVYSKVGKIASVGINVKQGTSIHGVSINISNDLRDFSLISPCGVTGQAMDRVADYQKITVFEAFEMWCSEFERLLPGSKRASLTSQPRSF
jgi:lipoyl(octanoyl) transferase